MALRALARVNLAAIERNVVRAPRGAGRRGNAVRGREGRRLRPRRGPRRPRALAGGATSLAVATAQEAAELRAAGITEPVLVMGGDQHGGAAGRAGGTAEVVAWSERFVSGLAGAAMAPIRVHVKLDSGMGRLGTREVSEALAVAERVLAGSPALELAGAMTHFATADGDPEFMAAQLAVFEPFAAELRRRAPWIIVHAANSAATVNEPRATSTWSAAGSRSTVVTR